MPTAGAYCQRGAVGPRPIVGLLYEVGISDCSLVLIYYLYINLDNITDGYCHPVAMYKPPQASPTIGYYN